MAWLIGTSGASGIWQSKYESPSGNFYTHMVAFLRSGQGTGSSSADHENTKKRRPNLEVKITGTNQAVSDEFGKIEIQTLS